jgi:hypothetical protein
MKLLNSIAVFFVFLTMSAATVALPTDYTFDVNFTSGGPSAPVPVYVTLEGVTGNDIEIFRPNLNNILKFEFTFSSDTFEMTDNPTFPSLPLIQLEDGSLTGIQFMGRQSALGGRITTNGNIELTDQLNSIAYVIVSPGRVSFAFGEVAPETWRRIAAPVPAPATFALVALALTALSVRRRKKVAN